jgi:hypothetical protein
MKELIEKLQSRIKEAELRRNLPDMLSAYPYMAGVLMSVNEAKKIIEALKHPDVSGSASDFEVELYRLINRYVDAGLKKPDLIHKMEYVTQSCRVS